MGKATAKAKAGKRKTLKLTGTAKAGRYRYVVRIGRKTLKRGGFTVKAKSGSTLRPARSSAPGRASGGA